MSFQLSGRGPEIYETTMVPLWFGRWADELLNLVSLAPGERVLDVACGTGVTTRLAHQQVGPSGRVVGLDINEAMLAKAQVLGRELEIEWRHSDVTDTGLASESFDAVISQHGYHYFGDKPSALAEFVRVLVPGGRIALSIWEGHSPYTTAICAAVEQFISPEIAQQQRSQRETPTRDGLISSFAAAGLRNVDVIRQELTIKVPLAAEFVPLHLGSMPISGAFHALPASGKDALITAVADKMQDYVVGDQMVYRDVVNVVMGTK